MSRGTGDEETKTMAKNCVKRQRGLEVTDLGPGHKEQEISNNVEGDARGLPN